MIAGVHGRAFETFLKQRSHANLGQGVGKGYFIQRLAQIIAKAKNQGLKRQ